jgi:hypothetical protein
MLPPPATNLTSNAALAGATSNPAAMDPAHDLRIADTPRASAPDYRAAQGAGGWSGSALQKPEPVNSNPTDGTRPSPVPMIRSPAAAATSAPPGPAATYEQARAQLEARSVSWSKLEQDQDQWQFTCSVPNSQNPSVSKTYVGKASTPLDAMRVVLKEIDAQR